MKAALVSWSGGKDSRYALMKAISQGIQPVALLNMMNGNGKVSRSHAIPLPVLQLQAKAMGQVPLYTVPASWSEYEKEYVAALKRIKKEREIDCAVFGDIDLQPHRDWEEKVSRAADIDAVLPLWQLDRTTLVLQMIADGIEAVIVSCNTKLAADFLGEKMTTGLVEGLAALDIDACGENGEFHTLVVNCPLFSNRVKVAFGKKLIHKDYCFMEMTALDNE